MDFYGPLPRSVAVVRYVLVAIDVFTKFVEFYPLKKATTLAATRCLQNKYFPSVGKPKRILVDHGTQFTSRHFAAFTQENGVKLVFSSVRHPQGNPAERVMRELSRLFRTYCSDNHTGWAKAMKSFGDMINNVVHESTGFAPIQLHFGKVPSSPFRELFVYPSPDVHVDPNASYLLALDNLRSRAALRAGRAVVNKVEHRWQPGDLVWLRANPIPQDTSLQTRKFFPLYEGPYSVKKQVATKTYVLYHKDSERERGTFHAIHLRPYYPATPLNL